MSNSNKKESLLILIPYRDRQTHLLTLIVHLHKFLEAIPHRFVVVEQVDDLPFNKGRLLNIAFALLCNQTSSVCFHDVDMLPLDDPRHYTIRGRTVHISGRMEQFDYELPYPEFMGGVFLSPVEDFRRVNGFSNEYWGWGSEDDELFARYQMAGVPIERRAGRYRSLPHERAAASRPNADRLMRTLAAVAAMEHDPDSRARIEHLQNNYKKTFGIEKWVPKDAQSDGLNTLAYGTVSRSPLGRAFNFGCELSYADELLRVSLD